MVREEIQYLHDILQFLDRMNTTAIEVDVVTDFPDANALNQRYGTTLRTKTTLNVRGIDNLFQLFEEVSQTSSTWVVHISFTNAVMSGTINILQKSVNFIFHTIENIENIVHQLIDIPIPTFELNIKFLYTGIRRPRYFAS